MAACERNCGECARCIGAFAQIAIDEKNVEIKALTLELNAAKNDLRLSKEICRRLQGEKTTVQDAAFWEKAAHHNMDRANKLEKWLQTTSYETWKRAFDEGVISIAVGQAEPAGVGKRKDASPFDCDKHGIALPCPKCRATSCYGGL